MNDLQRRLKTWERFDEARTAEQRRRAFLQQTPPANPAHLYEPIRVRILRPFWFNHKVLAKGSVIDLPKCVANEALAIKRAERVE